MANFYESDNDTEQLGFPNVVLPYQSYGERFYVNKIIGLMMRSVM